MAVPGRLLLNLRLPGPLHRRRALGVALTLAVAGLAACGNGAGHPAADQPVGSGAHANPIACTAASKPGTFASPPDGTRLTIEQISQAVGLPVSDAEIDSPATGIFNGFEACQYTFTSAGLAANENVTVVVGTNPLDNRSAQDEFTDTEASEVPLSNRGCTSNGCSYHFTSLPGLGMAAVKGHNARAEVIAVRTGSSYVEIGPGDLKEPQMIDLAQAVVSSLP